LFLTLGISHAPEGIKIITNVAIIMHRHLRPPVPLRGKRRERGTGEGRKKEREEFRGID